MHAVGIWCKTKIQIDPGGLEVNFSLQGLTAFLPFAFVFIETKAVWYYNEVTREVSRRIEGGVIGK